VQPTYSVLLALLSLQELGEPEGQYEEEVAEEEQYEEEGAAAAAVAAAEEAAAAEEGEETQQQLEGEEGAEEQHAEDEQQQQEEAVVEEDEEQQQHFEEEQEAAAEAGAASAEEERMQATEEAEQAEDAGVCVQQSPERGWGNMGMPHMPPDGSCSVVFFWPSCLMFWRHLCTCSALLPPHVQARRWSSSQLRSRQPRPWKPKRSPSSC
jgi:DNA segregation ATPase FtsK/SpoIIIE-like protein